MKSETMNQSEKLVALVERLGIELFQDEKERSYAAINDNGRKIYPCKSKNFKSWLAYQVWLKEKKVFSSDAINSALNIIEGKALYEGSQYKIHNRVAWHDKALWYDLTDDGWQAVKVTSENWGVVEKPPILFRRYTHQSPQVMPQKEGKLDLIWNFVNIKEEQYKLLYMVHLISSFIPGIPHPVLVPYGEQGAAKTTLCKIGRQIVDPSITEVLQLPGNKAEFIQLLDHHWVACFDNVSSLSTEYSDLICMAVTGQGFSKRGLYTDDEDVIYVFKRVIALNGINVAVTQPDLMDRSILLELQPIPDEERKEEKEMWEAFEKAKPLILGGIFDVLSRSLKIYDDIKLERLPRMADFARWGCAIAKALGHESVEFLNAYEGNIKSQNDEVLSGDLVCHAICHFMKDKESWQGTASELLEKLGKLKNELHINTNDKSWPKAPNSLTRRLNIHKPNLRRIGILLDNYTYANKRLLTISKSNSCDDTDDANDNIKKTPSGGKPINNNQFNDNDDIDDIISSFEEKNRYTH